MYAMGNRPYHLQTTYGFAGNSPKEGQLLSKQNPQLTIQVEDEADEFSFSQSTGAVRKFPDPYQFENSEEKFGSSNEVFNEESYFENEKAISALLELVSIEKS